MKSDPAYSCIMLPPKRRRLRSKTVTVVVQPMEAQGFSRVDGFDLPNGIRFPLPPKISFHER